MSNTKLVLFVLVLALGQNFQPVASDFDRDALDNIYMGGLLPYLPVLDALSNGIMNSSEQLFNAALGQAGANTTIYLKAAIVDLEREMGNVYPTLLTLVNNTEITLTSVMKEIFNAQQLGQGKLGNTAIAIGNAVKSLRIIHDETQKTTASGTGAGFLIRAKDQLNTAFSILDTIINGIYDLVKQRVLDNLARLQKNLGNPPKYERFGTYINAAYNTYTFGGAVYQREEEVHFMFYPDPTKPEQSIVLGIGDLEKLKTSGYNKDYPLLLIITGLVSEVNIAETIKLAFMDSCEPLNLVVVEWDYVAGQVIMPPVMSNTFVDYIGAYVQMASNVNFTATIVNNFLQFLNTNQYLRKLTEGGTTLVDAHFVCHSLGAHVCGLAANQYKIAVAGEMIKRITAADPAGPLYQNGEDRFNSNQARYTQALITNAGGFGLSINNTNIAGADIYINGGWHQPGCTSGNDTNIQNVDLKGPCSHNMATAYFVESTKTAFTTNGCLVGICTPTGTHIGEQIDLGASGIYTAAIPAL